MKSVILILFCFSVYTANSQIKKKSFSTDHYASVTTKFNSCSSLSTEDQKNTEHSDFSILPNPVKGDFLKVVFPKSIKKTEVFILDLSGKRIKQLKISVDKPKVFIGDLSKGLYLIQLKTLSTKKTFKIIKE